MTVPDARLTAASRGHPQPAGSPSVTYRVKRLGTSPLQWPVGSSGLVVRPRLRGSAHRPPPVVWRGARRARSQSASRRAVSPRWRWVGGMVGGGSGHPAKPMRAAVTIKPGGAR